MKILIIDEEFPYPMNTGKRLRSLNLAKQLARTDDVSYLAYGEESSDAYRFVQSCGITPYAVPAPDRSQHGLGFYYRLARNLLSPYPYIVTSHYTRRFQQALDRLHDEGKFDLILCEWTPYAIFLKNINSTRKAIVAHNIESDIWQQMKEREESRLRKFYISIQHRKVREFEQTCFKWADGATAVCQSEADTLGSFGIDYPVEVVDNGVDTVYFSPQQADIDPDTLVFTGSMDWRPNQDAALYFVNEIFPLLKLKRPGVKAVFVGRKPPKQITALGEVSGITITGTVDDVRSYIARAAIYIVPLRIGGGSRLKILEALAMEKPVVSTSHGAHGLDVEDGKHLVIADGAQEFAEAVLTSLDDSQLRSRIAADGRAQVLTHYNWERLGAKLRNYLQSICDKK